MKYQLRNSEFHLTPREISQLLMGISNPRNRLITTLFVYTGIRRVELQMLRWSDVEPDRHRLIVRHGKGGKQRIVFLPDLVMRELRNFHSGERLNEFLFPGRKSRPMSLRNINYILSHAGEEAGVNTPNPRYKNIGPHLLRHSFARNWKNSGGSLESLQKILGHSSLRTTLDIYGTESQADVEANYHEVSSKLALPAETSHF